MLFENVSTKDVMRELLDRAGRENSCIEIELGKIMMIGYYPNHADGPQYMVACESHGTLKTTSVDAALDRLFDLWDPDNV